MQDKNMRIATQEVCLRRLACLPWPLCRLVVSRQEIRRKGSSRLRYLRMRGRPERSTWNNREKEGPQRATKRMDSRRTQVFSLLRLAEKKREKKGGKRMRWGGDATNASRRGRVQDKETQCRHTNNVQRPSSDQGSEKAALQAEGYHGYNGMI